MTLEKHTASSRGFANHGWLQANHSFSFANFYDPNKLNFGALRVLNDDLIAPNMGFSTHPHQNMEIITIPLSGVLKHKDNMSNAWLEVRPNEIQVMSAGTGIYHSEINGSSQEHLSLYQIWITPDRNDVKPRYNQRYFDQEGRKNKLQVLVSSIEDDRDDVLKIHQNAQLSRIDLEQDTSFTYQLKSSRHGVYVMMISGCVTIGKATLNQRDALCVSETTEFTINATEVTELLFIEVPLV